MAIAVIGGLIVSTALSLLVVPCFYLVADRVKSRLAGRSAARSTRGKRGGAIPLRGTAAPVERG